MSKQMKKLQQLFNQYGQIENQCGGNSISCPLCKTISSDPTWCASCGICYDLCYSESCHFGSSDIDHVGLPMRLIAWSENDLMNSFNENLLIHKKLDHKPKIYLMMCPNCYSISVVQNSFRLDIYNAEEDILRQLMKPKIFNRFQKLITVLN
jgi:ferredoxin